MIAQCFVFCLPAREWMKNPELILFLFLLAHDMAFKNVVSQTLGNQSKHTHMEERVLLSGLVEYLEILDDIQIYLWYLEILDDIWWLVQSPLSLTDQFRQLGFPRLPRARCPKTRFSTLWLYNALQCSCQACSNHRSVSRSEEKASDGDWCVL